MLLSSYFLWSLRQIFLAGQSQKNFFFLIGEKKFNEVCDINSSLVILDVWSCVKIHIDLETRLATFWEPPVMNIECASLTGLWIVPGVSWLLLTVGLHVSDCTHRHYGLGGKRSPFLALFQVSLQLSIQLVSVCRQFRVFHQITDDHSNPMGGFGASYSLGPMTSSNSQLPLTSQSGNMLSVTTTGCWMDCKPVWLRPAEGKRDKLHPQQWSETLPGGPSCLLRGEIEGLCLLTASAFVWCCDDDFIMSSTTPQIIREKIWRPTSFGCVSVFCAGMGSNIKHRNRWTPVTAEVFKTFSLHFHLHTSNLNSDPEWCHVQDKQWRVRLETFSPVDVRFLHHRFHSVVELRENHVLREENIGQLFIPNTQISCERSRKTFWPSAGEGTSAESWLQWNSKIPPKETGWWCPSAKHTANTHRGETKGLKPF